MASTVDLCPQCRGKLVPIGERTGGFSGTKAVVGAVLVGPVGVAAGATGKQLVTLQCAECGYTIETDAKIAQEAAAYGVAFEQYCQQMDKLRKQRCKLEIPPVKLLQDYGYDSREFGLLGYLKRKEERNKIGIDAETVENSVKAINQKYEEKMQALKDEYKSRESKQEQAEIDKLSAEYKQSAKEKIKQEEYLHTLGFFKFSEKKKTSEQIASLEKEMQDITERKSALQETINRSKQAQKNAQDKLKKQEMDEIRQARSELVERCRVLAYAWMEAHLPKEYHQFLGAVYSVLSEKPMTSKEIHALLDPKSESMASLQFLQRIRCFSNPFVSVSQEGSSPSPTYFLGAEGNYDPGRTQRQMNRKQETDLKKAMADRHPECSEEEIANRVKRMLEGVRESSFAKSKEYWLPVIDKHYPEMSEAEKDDLIKKIVTGTINL